MRLAVSRAVTRFAFVYLLLVLILCVTKTLLHSERTLFIVQVYCVHTAASGEH